MKSIRRFITSLKKKYIKVISINEQRKQFLIKSYYDKGEFELACGKHEKAVACFDIIIELNPNNADSYFLRGSAEEGLGQYDAALSDYDEAIKLDPNDAHFYYNRGHLKMQLLSERLSERGDLLAQSADLGQIRDTKEDLETALQIVKNDTLKNMVEEAIRHLEFRF